MAIIAGTPNQVASSGAATGGTAPTIQNISMPTAGTEYSASLPANTKRFKVLARGSSKLKLAYVSGQTGTNFISLYPGGLYEEVGLGITGITLYAQASQDGEVLELVSWS